MLTAGEEAGTLTEEGAALLDASGLLKPGILLCPPERRRYRNDGDKQCKGENRKCLRRNLRFRDGGAGERIVRVYPEIDLVTTPSGNLVGMVHCNNCTSDLNAWVNIFKKSILRRWE